MEQAKLYTRLNCRHSLKLKSLLDEKNVPYTELDVDTEDVTGKVVKVDGYIPTPQVDIDGKIIYDYTTEEDLAKEIEHLRVHPSSALYATFSAVL